MKMGDLQAKLGARAAGLRAAQAGGVAGIPLQIPLGDIVPDPNQPRKYFSQASLDEMAASIRSRGILQPITVTPSIDGKHEIIMGERRWRGAGIVGLPTVPAIVRERTPQDAVDQMIENVQRADLTPAEWAAHIEKRRAAGLKDVSIAAELGVDKTRVSRYGRVLKMPAELRSLADALSINVLCELHSAWSDDSGAVLAFLGATPVTEITEVAARALHRRIAEPTIDEAADTAEPAPTQLQPAAPSQPLPPPAIGDPGAIDRDEPPLPFPVPPVSAAASPRPVEESLDTAPPSGGDVPAVERSHAPTPEARPNPLPAAVSGVAPNAGDVTVMLMSRSGRLVPNDRLVSIELDDGTTIAARIDDLVFVAIR
jgi:ParB family chromosome partitioning protein